MEAIKGFGFGGLIQLACREICYKLCHYLISHYEVTYHRIRLERDRTLDVTIVDVMNIMGIPLGGLDVVVHSRHGLTSQVYSLNTLEEKLIDLDVIDLHVLIRFMKLCYRWFLIRSLDKQKKNCCSIAPNTILTPQPLQPLPQALVERYGLYNQ